MPSGCATATGRPLPLERLAGTCVYSLPRSCESVARLEDVAAELGFPLAIAVRAADPELLLQLVERAGGCALLPRLAVWTGPGWTTLALDRRLPPRMVSVVQRDGPGRSPAAESLVGALHRAVESRLPAAPGVEGTARAI